MTRQQRKDRPESLEELAADEASQSSLGELDPDTDDEASEPGRGTVSGSGEPSPTGTVGISDFPVDDRDSSR